MDRLKKERGTLRTLFTKAVTPLEAELGKENLDSVVIHTLLANLENRGALIAELDVQIGELMKAADTEEEEFTLEFESRFLYADKLDLCRKRVNKLLAVQSKKTVPDQEAGRVQGGDIQSKKSQLPPIELKKFGGDIKDWLAFWSQFEKIEMDKEMPDQDKFYYLRQSTIEGSKAREVVDSFPMSAVNYPKAVSHLQSRFGNKDTLVEVYVRELLKLVLCNALYPKQKIGLASLYDKLEAQLRALESLGVTSDKFAAILYPLVESSLPEDVLRAWERSQTYASVPQPGADGTVVAPSRLTQLMSFLRGEVDSEERISLARSGFGVQAASKQKVQKYEDSHSDIPTAQGLFSGQQESSKEKRSSCIFCGKSHQSEKCFGAQRMTLDARKKILVDKRACFVCLRTGHNANKCHSREHIKCSDCGRCHYKILCRDFSAIKTDPGKKQETQRSTAATSEEKSEQTDKTLANQTCTTEVLLQTLLVRVLFNGQEKVIRALIDNGSQNTYLLKSLAAEFGLKSLGERKLLHGLFGGLESAEQNHQIYRIHIQSLDRSFRCNFEVMDESKICTSVPKYTKGPWMEELKSKNIFLTDLGSGSTEVELLIGADIAGKLLTSQFKELSYGPVAVKTQLGWTLMGKNPRSQKPKVNTTLLVHNLFVREASVSDLWRLDTIGIMDAAETKEKENCQQAAMDHFMDTVCVNEEGRYEVALPWIEGHPPLKSNKVLAEKRLQNLVRKLRPELKVKYGNIFEYWLAEGIIEEVPPDQLNLGGHYLPHRAVEKPSSATTPVRPVFDASAKEKNSPSLNDCLAKGPNILLIIVAVILRFRLKRIGVVADICKAFLMISVRPEDRDNLRFLWYGADGDIIVYRHRRVVFGMTSSPFLLAATLNFILDRAPVEFRDSAKLLKSALYVDNCVTSVEDERAVKKFQEQSTKLLSDANFDLRLWMWNDGNSAEKIPLLGLTWDMGNDTLICDIKKGIEIESPITKRKILSAAHQIFDPIGFTVPLMLSPKLLLQECWNQKVSWDAELPEEISCRFLKWVRQLAKVGEIIIPRWIGGTVQNEESWSLHVFSDASKLAYSACVFLRIEEDGKVLVNLLQAKARVAPLAKLSIPRLELLGCLVAARLATSVKKELCLEKVSCTYWTDSQNALYWIKKEDSWGTYVWSRVKEIRELTDGDNWRYVPGKLNPADLPSRGCTAKQLLESKWWEGPTWLQSPPNEWPSIVVAADEDVLNSERKKIVVSSLAQNKIKVDTSWISKDSASYMRMVRKVAFVWRFLKNTMKKSKEERVSGRISVEELEFAEETIIKLVQIETFSDKLDALLPLDVFKDVNGILRVKTKILLREDAKEFRTPAVLPSEHAVVKSLIEFTHKGLSHAGIQIIMAFLREKFWIIKARSIVKRIIRNCVRCRRFVATPFVPVPAPLPEDRVRDAAVFEVTGVDLAGPLFLVGKKKVWIVLYTCAVYRAVHLELVTTLSTEGFLQSFRRFIARRGRPSIVYSDNGTNFVGAENSLKKLDWDKISTTATAQRIVWKFNPPTASWWGGWWERLIGMVKNLLRRVLGRASLHGEELYTILCDCESVINARPLTYLSEDSSEYVPLTPAMFLQEVRECGVPDLDELDARGLSRRCRYLHQVRKDLRVRFRSEYLGQLQHRAGSRITRTVEVGEIVYVGSDNSKRIDWPLGRVMAVFPGKDENTRVVQVKTAGGEFTRPIQRLYPLEMSVSDSVSVLGDKATTSGVEGSLQLESKSCASPVFTRFGRKVKAVDRLNL